MQSAQICGRKRGARVSGERRARKSESRRVFTGRGRKKKLSRDAAEARVPLRDRVSPRVSRAGQGRRDGPRSRVLVSAYHSRAEKGLIGIHGGGGRVRTPLSRCCCSSRKMAAASGDAMAAARGRRTSFGAPHASTRVIDESRTRPARKGPRRVRRSIGRVGRARGSARRGLGHVGNYNWPHHRGMISATDLFSRAATTFAQETRRLRCRDTSHRAVSDRKNPPCIAARATATARPGIAVSSPSHARRGRRSRRLERGTPRRVRDAYASVSGVRQPSGRVARVLVD